MITGHGILLRHVFIASDDIGLSRQMSLKQVAAMAK